MAAPIYVETLIHGAMDDLWAKTQQPELHQRWDLRFTSITYLPRPGINAPQRFRYTTRIGFGLAISGEGETRATPTDHDGRRTSALTFWSDHPLSLIARGAGYWQYVPTGDGIRFITRYDYTPRFAVLGRWVDRALFRPLIGWATAWSFDRLRLWIEDGVPPEHSRRYALVRLGVTGALLTAAAASLAAGRRDRHAPRSAVSLTLVGTAAPLGLLAPRCVPLARRCRRRPRGAR